MKISTLKSTFTKISLVSAVFGMLLFSSFLTVYGVVVTFANFSEKNGTQDFIFTNNTPTLSGMFTTIGGGSPVDFKYFNIVGLNATLTGFQNAHLFITTTTTPATAVGANVTQPLNQTVTIQIIRDTVPTGVPCSGSCTNLLTAVYLFTVADTPAIVGRGGANLNASTPGNIVTFTSDLISFTSTMDRILALSFSSVTPPTAIGAGGFLRSFTAAGTGTFASDPVPTTMIITSGGVSLSGRVTTANGSGVRNAQVFLTDAAGTVYTAITGAFGYFTFSDIESGQTVIVSVRSKRNTFSPQVVSLQDSVADLSFVASP